MGTFLWQLSDSTFRSFTSVCPRPYGLPHTLPGKSASGHVIVIQQLILYGNVIQCPRGGSTLAASRTLSDIYSPKTDPHTDGKMQTSASRIWNLIDSLLVCSFNQLVEIGCSGQTNRSRLTRNLLHGGNKNCPEGWAPLWLFKSSSICVLSVRNVNLSTTSAWDLPSSERTGQSTDGFVCLCWITS